MKAIKASVAGIENDSGIICYLSLREALVMKAALRNISGSVETTLRKYTRPMVLALGSAGVSLGGPELFANYLTGTDNALAKLEESVEYSNA